jgi:hypothetical protein
MATMTSPGRIVVRNALQLSACPRPPRQLSMSLDSMELKGMSEAERAAAVSRLAKLMMEAAGVAVEESGHDGR